MIIQPACADHVSGSHSSTKNPHGDRLAPSSFTTVGLSFIIPNRVSLRWCFPIQLYELK